MALYETGFEPPAYNPGDIIVPYVPGELDGHGVIQNSIVNSGLQAFHIWGKKLYEWGPDTVPFHKNLDSATYYQFTGGPLDDSAGVATPTVKLSEVIGQGYGIESELYTSFNGYLHFANEWLWWDASKNRYVPWVSNAYPRAIVANSGVPIVDTAYQRAYFYWIENRGYHEFMRFWSTVSGRNYVGQARIGANGSSITLSALDVGERTFSVTVPMNQWVCMEFGWIRGVNGGVVLEINGVEVARLTGDTSNAPSPSTMRTGISLMGSWGSPYYPPNPIGLEFYFDDWAYGTERIGPLAVPRHTLAVDSNIQGTPFNVRRVA